MTGAEDSSALDRLADWLTRFIVTQHDDGIDTLALWVAHTHFLASVESSPRLIVTSAYPASGKSTALEHVAALAGNSRQPMANAPTPALLARITPGQTVLIDEADSHIGGRGSEARELFGIVNQGYRRGGVVTVLEQTPSGRWEPVEHDVFGAVAMAGISPNLPPAFESRCLTVHLMPDVVGLANETYWPEIRDEAMGLRRHLAEWAATVDLVSRPELPSGVRNRDRELFTPLAQVAAAAGGGWSERLASIIGTVLEQRQFAHEDGIDEAPPNVLLVRDIFGVWHIADPEQVGFAPTLDLLDALHALNPERWGSHQLGRTPLNRQRVAAMLNRQGIRSEREQGGARRRGYREAAFRRAWQAVGLDPRNVHPDGFNIKV